jgi:dTMP kinase
MVPVALLALMLGFASGVAWVTGYTLLGTEVDPSLQGRTFALVQSLVRLALAAVLALAPLTAGLLGATSVDLPAVGALSYSGAQLTVLAAGLLAVAAGAVCLRRMSQLHRPGQRRVSDSVRP